MPLSQWIHITIGYSIIDGIKLHFSATQRECVFCFFVIRSLWYAQMLVKYSISQILNLYALHQIAIMHCLVKHLSIHILPLLHRSLPQSTFLFLLATSVHKAWQTLRYFDNTSLCILPRTSLSQSEVNNHLQLVYFEWRHNPNSNLFLV